MAVMQSVRPVDRLLLGYNVVFAAVWTALAGRVSYAPWILAGHAAAATLPWLLARGDAPLSRPVRGLRELYPLLWLCAFWGELGFIRELLHPGAHDAAIRAVDLRIFGVHLNELWMPSMPAMWVSELMHLLYFAYYPLIFVPPIAVGLMGRHEALRDMMFRLLVTYAGCYLVYLVFPVDGPGHTVPRYDGALTDGFVYGLVHRAVHAGDSLGTAFPSSHVAGAVTIALLGWRWFWPGVAALFTLEAMGVVLSTIYTQQHYAVDAVAGLAWALVLQALIAPWLGRVLETIPQRVPATRPRVLTPVPVPARTSDGVR